MKYKKAQSTLEMSLLIIVITFALLAMTVYMKRAIQGKIRQTADDMGEQYSPTMMNSSLTTAINSTAISITEVENEGELNATSVSTTNSNETTTRTGYEEVQGYAGEPLF